MKRLVIAVLGIFLFSTQAIAGEVVRLTEHVDENGKRTIYQTTRDVLEKCPEWKTSEELPLPVHKAVEIATQWVKEKYPKFVNFKVVNISLSEIWDDKYKDRWYYSISVNGNVDLDGIRANSYFSVMVLMDGTIVGPSLPKSDDQQ
ncbi:MAG: hypothetical protein WC317_04460 [Candidatus Omnitrophota bacterium]|jgi:hypothetical protein